MFLLTVTHVLLVLLKSNVCISYPPLKWILTNQCNGGAFCQTKASKFLVLSRNVGAAQTKS